MPYKNLLNTISRGVLAPVYIISGDEEYLQELMLKALKDHLIAPGCGAFNLDELDGEKASPAQIVQSAVMLPVFAEKRLVIVYNAVFLQAGKKDKDAAESTAVPGLSGNDNVTGEDDVSAKTAPVDDALVKYLSDPLASTCLVFWVKGQVDKRKRIVKAVAKAGTVLEVNACKGSELNEWLRAEARLLGKTLEPKALEYMVLMCGNSMRHLRNELEKLALYCGNGKAITLAAAEKLLTKTSEASIFVLVDNIGMKKAQTALNELASLLEQGEPGVRVLFMIARQFRLILLAKEMAGRGLIEKQIASGLALHPFVAAKALRQAANFTFSELEDSLERILEADAAIKTGTPQKAALEGLILGLAGKTAGNNKPGVL